MTDAIVQNDTVEPSAVTDIGMVRRVIMSGIVQRFVPDARQCTVMVTNQDPAPDGFSIRTDGLDRTQYEQNPIVLAYHDVTRPVGTMVEMHQIGTSLHGTIQFAPQGTSEDADQMCGLVKAGVVRGVSIGFSVLDTKPGRNGITMVNRSVLHEVSMCTIPMLNAALVTGRLYGTVADAAVEARLQHARQMRLRHRGEENRREMASIRAREFRGGA